VKPWVIEVSRRLRQTRNALGYTQSQLCRLTEINAQVWNNAETGDNMLSVSNAVRLRSKTGIPLDWIYCGQMDTSMPQNLRVLIIQQDKR